MGLTIFCLQAMPCHVSALPVQAAMARPDVRRGNELSPSLQPQAVSRAIQRVDIDAASATATGSRLWFRLAEQI